VVYDAEKIPLVSPSVGAILKESLGPRLYTIMPFAEAGGAYLINVDLSGKRYKRGASPDLGRGYGRVYGGRGPLGAFLSRLSDRDYFLDLRELDPTSRLRALFWAEQPIWVENSQWRLALARDFDGIIWIKRLHSPGGAGGGSVARTRQRDQRTRS